MASYPASSRPEFDRSRIQGFGNAIEPPLRTQQQSEDELPWFEEVAGALPEFSDVGSALFSGWQNVASVVAGLADAVTEGVDELGGTPSRSKKIQHLDENSAMIVKNQSNFIENLSFFI